MFATVYMPQSETTVYSDRPSMVQYPPPISDAFVNKEYYFFFIKHTFIDDKPVSFYLAIFFRCYKKHIKLEGIIQSSKPLLSFKFVFTTGPT